MVLSSAVPPPPRPPITASPSELLALRFIVMSLVAVMADGYEKSGGGPAQSWINQIAVFCNEAITLADFFPPDGRDIEGMRREALEHVNHILGGIKFPRQRGNAN